METARCTACGTTFSPNVSSDGMCSCPGCGAPHRDAHASPSQSFASSSQDCGESEGYPAAGAPVPPHGNPGNGDSGTDGGCIKDEDSEVRTPWEENPGVGTFLSTLRLLATQPSGTFSRMPNHDAKGALSFYFVCGIIALSLRILVEATIEKLRGWAPHNSLGISKFVDDLSALSADSELPVIPISVLLLLLLVIIGFYAASGIIHVSGLITGGTTQKFSATMRAVGYGVFPWILGAIPIVGSRASSLLMWGCIGLGFRHLHRVSGVKAALTILLPFIAVVFGACGFGFISGLAHH